MHAPPPPQTSEKTAPGHAPMTFREFVLVVAGLMALNALAIDVMIPALQEIGATLGVEDENRRQAILPVYLVGFGLGQLLVGSISDRYGRRPVLLWGLALYVAAAILCAVAPSFEALLAGRFAQGIASAAPRVVTTSIVRDCYSGRRMASVTSLAMTVFLAVPVIAPSLGQAILLVAPWQAIFLVLAVYGLAMMAWTGWRLPETLPAERRRSIAPRAIAAAAREVVSTRATFGYALAGGFMFAAMFGFIVSAEQIFTEVYGLGVWFPLAFAGAAAAMSVSALVNARLVGRIGMRRLSHGAVAAFVAMAAALLVLARLDALTFPLFMALLAGTMMLVGLIFANFNALAMEPMGHIAGTAASVFGSTTTLMASLIGGALGQAYDGTLVPLATGYLTLGIATLGAIAYAEGGRLFRR